MFLLIDNYDSFTYNLVQAFYALGHEPVVLRNDDPAILDMAADPSLEMVCISPGPGHPSQTGFCPEFLRRLPHHVPVLGVCLGHQLLGLHAGARVDVGPCIMHGKQSEIVHDGSGLFEGLPNPMKVARYHSLVVHAGEGEGNALFTVTARAPEGEVMALQYRDRPWVGVQFHPESILTPDGLRLLGNFPQAILPRQGRDGGMAEVLEHLARQGQCLEVNTGAVTRGYRRVPYPAEPLLRRWRELGGEIILNSDAHHVSHLCAGFREAEELVKEFGFTHINIWTRDGLRPEPLSRG